MANTPVRPSTGNGSGYMCGTKREMHSSRSSRLAHGKPEPRGSSPRLLAVRTGVRFFKRAAADSLGIWISSQEGPAHHSRVNLTIQVPTDLPVQQPPRLRVASPGRGKQRLTEGLVCRTSSSFPAAESNWRSSPILLAWSRRTRIVLGRPAAPAVRPPYVPWRTPAPCRGC